MDKEEKMDKIFNPDKHYTENIKEEKKETKLSQPKVFNRPMDNKEIENFREILAKSYKVGKELIDCNIQGEDAIYYLMKEDGTWRPIFRINCRGKN